MSSPVAVRILPTLPLDQHHHHVVRYLSPGPFHRHKETTIRSPFSIQALPSSPTCQSCLHVTLVCRMVATESISQQASRRRRSIWAWKASIFVGTFITFSAFAWTIQMALILRLDPEASLLSLCGKDESKTFTGPIWHHAMYDHVP